MHYRIFTILVEKYFCGSFFFNTTLWKTLTHTVDPINSNFSHFFIECLFIIFSTFWIFLILGKSFIHTHVSQITFPFFSQHFLFYSLFFLSFLYPSYKIPLVLFFHELFLILSKRNASLFFSGFFLCTLGFFFK